MIPARCPHCGEMVEVTLAAASPSADLVDRVHRFIAEHQPCSKRAIRRGVHGGSDAIDAALRTLESAGTITNTSEGYAACQARPQLSQAMRTSLLAVADRERTP